MSSSFGRAFSITTFGESHGRGLGVVVDGCPPGVRLDEGWVQAELDRRRPGQSRLVTQRQEADRVEILSGVDGGVTLGTPIAMLVRNDDARGRDYRDLELLYRPSHADFTYDAKYGRRAVAGGGRASARETVGRVAAGAVAKAVLESTYGVTIVGWVSQVHDIAAALDPSKVTRAKVESNPVRCPDAAVAERMIGAIERARKDGDSLGGIVSCVARGVPPGWGEPVFDKLEADLAKAMLSIPACKGFESGAGFQAVLMTGRTHNDALFKRGKRIRTRTNHAGGIVGGISNGEDVVLRAAFKPTATIVSEQETVDRRGRAAKLVGKGRHDPCVVPRAVPIVEAMTALVLIDHALRQRGLVGDRSRGRS